MKQKFLRTSTALVIILLMTVGIMVWKTECNAMMESEIGILQNEVSMCKRGTYRQPVPGHHRVAKEDRCDKMELMSDVLPQYQSQQRLNRSNCARCTEIEERIAAYKKTTAQATERRELENELLRAQIAALKK